MYMTLTEKYNYIDEDFKKSALYNLGDLPDEREAALEHFDRAIKESSNWLVRYKDRGSKVYKYAYAIAEDWMSTLEREYRRKFIGGAL